jgi:organic radical activating enzyme
MRLAGTISDVVNAYDDVAFEIYVSGCTRGCPGCHSPELQSFDVGQEITQHELYKLINLLSDESDF